VSNPLLWLGLSILLLAMSLTALLFVAIPTFLELSRAARSAEKLLDVLSRELPPTLYALRHTGSNLSSLADEVTEGVQSAQHLVKQVDQGLIEVRQQAQKVHHTSRGLWAGWQAAWQVLTASTPHQKRRQRPPTRRPPIEPSPMSNDSIENALSKNNAFVHPPNREGQSSITPLDFDPQRQTRD
jgi:uncharacterized protein YoxC